MDSRSWTEPAVQTARDELGIDVDGIANPIQAAVVSALSFVVGAVIPILVVVIVCRRLPCRRRLPSRWSG